MKYVLYPLLIVVLAACGPTATPAPTSTTVPTLTATPSTGWFGQPSAWVPTETDWTPPDASSPDPYKLINTEPFEFKIPTSALQAGDPNVYEENGITWVDFTITKYRLAPELNPAMFTVLEGMNAVGVTVKGTTYQFFAGDYRVIEEIDIDLGGSASQGEPAPTEIIMEATQTPVISNEISGCNDPVLTPEEAANCGQHTYKIEGKQVAGDCYFKLEDGSKVQSISKEETYTFIFESGAVRTIGEGSESISTKVDLNIYEYVEDDTVTLTTFSLDGWTDEFTWGECKDITVATLIE